MSGALEPGTAGVVLESPSSAGEISISIGDSVASEAGEVSTQAGIEAAEAAEEAIFASAAEAGNVGSGKHKFVVDSTLQLTIKPTGIGVSVATGLVTGATIAWISSITNVVGLLATIVVPFCQHYSDPRVHRRIEDVWFDVDGDGVIEKIQRLETWSDPGNPLLSVPKTVRHGKDWMKPDEPQWIERGMLQYQDDKYGQVNINFHGNVIPQNMQTTGKVTQILVGEREKGRSVGTIVKDLFGWFKAQDHAGNEWRQSMDAFGDFDRNGKNDTLPLMAEVSLNTVKNSCLLD